MSPFHKPVILDNNCICNFFFAGCLRSTLIFWPAGTFKIPQRVLNEARNWHKHGQEVCRILEELIDTGFIEIIEINENSEKETDSYIHLRLESPMLGQGESESIAIAWHRNYMVATDDVLATRRCHELYSAVQVITTAELFNMAMVDGLFRESQIIEMWKLIKSGRRQRE
jgi:predicted nucleic acid-binding protein